MAQVDIKKHIADEYKKCAKDPSYFIRKYCVIQHPKRGRIPFDLYGYQSECIDQFEEFQFNIILKGRQVGLSTAVAAYALWLMLFFRDKNVLVIATKQDTAKNLVTKVKYAFDHLPVWLQVPCTENNKLALRFKNGSQIKATTAAGDAGRSEALSLLILDEAAFIRNAAEIWVAALPTLSTGGKGILISTPNGVGNFFHKTYMKATGQETEKKESDDGVETFRFNPIKLDWRVVPGRDEIWERNTRASFNNPRDFRQEYEADFLGSGNTVIDEDIIQFYEETTVMKPIEQTGPDGNMWIWEHPDRSKKYIVVSDVARGDGQDNSAFHIIEVESGAQVAEYKGKMDTTEYAHFLIEWSTRYNDALLVVERENVGWSVLQVIIDRGYKNLFYMSKDRQVIEVEKNITTRYHAEEKKMLPGFSTSMRSRPLIINKLDTYMRSVFPYLDELEVIKQDIEQHLKDETFGVVIRSSRLIGELRVFIWENGKAQAMGGYNDDLVMSFAIALWIRDTSLKLLQEGIEVTKTALDGIRRREMQETEVRRPENLMYDPFMISVGSNPLTPQQEDLRWLF